MKPVFYEHRTESLFVGAICDHPFPAHVHDVVEILCLTHGRVEMTIAGRRFSVTPGDIAIAFPAVPHAYEDVTPDASGLTLIFMPDQISEFSRAFRTMAPVTPLLTAKEKTPELSMIIRNLLRLSVTDDSPLLLGYLHLFLSYLFTCITLRPMERQVQTGLSCQILQYISEHFTEPLTLESTAHALGISRIHLSHLFSQQLNINFRQYINTLRISHACSLLWNPEYTISQVAEMCGYGNPRTFHRAFLSQCHMAPNQYRAKQAQRGDLVVRYAEEEPPDEL